MMNIKRLLTMLTAGLLLALLVAPGPSPAAAQDVTSDLLSRINGLRASLGLPGYTLNGALSAAAQSHAQWMAQTGQVSHTQDNGSTPSSRAQAAGYPSSWVSENIYIGTNATSATAFQWWSNSPIHYRGMTNANYTEIGIGSASGPAFNGSTAFVLVFGNPTGYTPPVRTGGGSTESGGGGAPGLPPYVVGVDNNGFIMHEIQPGHTMGEIALIYGYSWDDLPYIREINGLTEAEARNNLEIGAILLIPPWEGTYTPTPGSPPESAPAGDVPADDVPQAEAPVEAAASATATPTPTATASATAAGVATVNAVPEWVVMTPMAEDTRSAQSLAASPTAAEPTPPVERSTAQAGTQTEGPAWTAATVTPTPGSTGIAVAAVDRPADGNAAGAAASVEEAGSVGGGTSPLLVVAVVLQVIILLLAGAEFLRRSRREAA